MTNCRPVKTEAVPFISRKTCLALAITQALLLAATNAGATTITVNNTSDTTSASYCDLRDAISAAQTDAQVGGCAAGSPTASDNIVFDSSLTTSATTVTLGGSALAVNADASGTSNLSIDGAGKITIDAATKSRVMQVNGGQLTLTGLNMTGGSSTAAGALLVYSGASVNLISSTVSGNSAGGISVNVGGLNLNYSTVSGNHGTNGGGIYAYQGTVSLSNSTVSGNSVLNNGGGIFLNYATASLRNSTISGNTADSFGGGIYLYYNSTATLNNSTISNNNALTNGGAIDTYTSADIVNLNNSTVSGNSATNKVGGIYFNGTTLNLNNSIIANSSSSQDCYLTGSASVTASNSLIQSSNSTYNCNISNGANGNIVGSAPLLGSLASNGGATQTLLPQSSPTASPVINAGNQASCLTTDQRGYFRTDGQCDIGSVEVGGALPTILQFAATTGSVNENGGSISITVNRSGVTTNAVTVAYATADGTAISSTDYTATSATLNFAANASTGTITVPIVDQGLTSGSKSFSVVLSNPAVSLGGGGASLGINTTDTITINDNDPVPASLQFSATSSSVNENAGSINISVTRTGDTSNAVSVAYATADGTAVSSTDYTATSSTLNFAANASTGTITVPIVDQGLTSGSKTFSVVLSNPAVSSGGGAASLGANTTDTVTINDNDTAKSSGGGGGGATSPLALLVMGLIWPLRRWRKRG